LFPTEVEDITIPLHLNSRAKNNVSICLFHHAPDVPPCLGVRLGHVRDLSEDAFLRIRNQEHIEIKLLLLKVSHLKFLQDLKRDVRTIKNLVFNFVNGCARVFRSLQNNNVNLRILMDENDGG